jgi:hypothetical protein
MLSAGLQARHRAVAVRTMVIDEQTARIATQFEQAGIDCILVKGPVIASWLYADAIRAYTDSDLLVADAHFDRAAALLFMDGFRDELAVMGHPRLESPIARGMRRGPLESIDLHVTLPGLGAPPSVVWDALWADARRQTVGGRAVAVPDHPAVLLHLALHVAHDPNLGKPLEDLRRGIRVADTDDWRRAAGLAERLDGLDAFASGLRQLPEGAALAPTLGVDHAGSVDLDLRRAAVPTAEGLNELLKPGMTLSARCLVVLGELFPKPSFMRWWTPLARRGTRGLVASYPLRWLWLAAKLPGGLAELRRARRRQAERRRVG